ncbi:TonB-dependent receptor [Pseudomaricurvus alkylphenolicus]|uniref:TonB-dependent receptor n=1 Tax=Pseudomaricurvus alkylphenolicus TaxID=1306991 RepID=UPI00141F2B28|nr:TonB-dependent receptor [Pseudomaricurvus alkylphenolicus]NIB38817.1 TonB-dependent receptor [Pseudomaricurvus alkylphenolicus]
MLVFPSAGRHRLFCAVVLPSLLFPYSLARAIDDFKLEEIIVTAQKREQSIQDVPMVVAAVTAEDLQASGVQSLDSLTHLVSGLVINTNNSLLLPFVRGVGSFNAGAATNTSVAVYVDGVYTPRSNALAFGLDNVAQIEVLKGPQSTLYGRNATGGAITITTHSPEPDEAAASQIRLSVGNYQQQRLSARTTRPLADNLAISLSGAIVRRDGYVDNLATATPLPGSLQDINNVDEKSLALKLLGSISETSEWELALSYREYDDTNNFGFRQFNPAFASDPGQYHSYGHWGLREGDDTAATLQGRFEFEPFTLVSVTGYLNNRFFGTAEVFSLPEAVAGFAADWEATTYSQELRLHAPDDADHPWLLGFQYFEEGDTDSQIWGALGAALSPAGEATLSPSAEHSLGDSDWQSRSHALFGEWIYRASEALSLTLGLRHTREAFSLKDNRDPGFFGAIGFVGVPVDSQREVWEELTYRAVLDYHTPWGLIYGSRAKGFVSGTLNVQNPAGAVVDPEILIAHEIGFKADVAAWGIRLNGALFDYDYQDIHAQTVSATTGFTNLVAGQKAAIRGMDLEWQGAVGEAWGYNLALTYLYEREYDEFSVPAGAGGFPAIEASGNTISGAPELTLALGVEHNHHTLRGRWQSNLSISHNSGVFYGVDESVGSGGDSDDAFTLVNVQTTFYPPHERWSLSLWLNNLFDEYYLSGGLRSGDSIVAVEAPPRFYGLTFTWRWGGE